MVSGIPPREASERLSIYQAKFDDLWRKFITYSGEIAAVFFYDYTFLWNLQNYIVKSHFVSHFSCILLRTKGFDPVYWKLFLKEKMS